MEALFRALSRLPDFTRLAPGDLEPLGAGGLAHAHIRLRGRGLLARVPRWSQYGLPPADNLAYQAACFRRTAASGRTPGLHVVLPPAPGLPFGALVVDEIEGRPVALPGDLDALAECLARIHALPLPQPGARPPLAFQDDPVASTLAIIETQFAFVDRAPIDRDARRQLAEELAWARRLAADRDRPPHPIALVGTDTHPGNFLIDSSGHAILHDLEKAMYGSPAIDLAHCTLATSTLWHRACPVRLAPAEIMGFYRAHLARIAAPMAEALRPWLLPMRRFTWLRTVTWCAKWLLERGGSAPLSNDERAVAGLIARFFHPDDMRGLRAEWLGSKPLPLMDLICS